MSDTARMRAQLAALAAEEEANPSRLWAPVTHDGPCQPLTASCCFRCCAAAPHEAHCSQEDEPIDS